RHHRADRYRRHLRLRTEPHRATAREWRWPHARGPREQPPALPAAGAVGAHSCRTLGVKWKARFIDTLERKTGHGFKLRAPRFSHADGLSAPRLPPRPV